MKPPAKLIPQVKTLADLAEGQRAFPERGVKYLIRPLGEIVIINFFVQYIERKGESIFAIRKSGETGKEIIGPRARYALKRLTLADTDDLEMRREKRMMGKGRKEYQRNLV